MTSIRRLYVDSNIFIYMFESDDKRAEKLRELFSTSRGTQPFLATSELTLSETLVGAYRNSNQDLIDIYSRWTITNDYLEVGPVQRDILWAAAVLRSTHRALKLPDAIHLATAFAFDCSHFLTADRGLSANYEFAETRLPTLSRVRGLVVLRPDDGILEDLLGIA